MFFKMSKQYLGIYGYQSTSIEAFKSKICLMMIFYTILSHAFIKDMHAKGKSLTKKYFKIFRNRNAYCCKIQDEY